MAYKSKFTGKQIDDYLDSIEAKQDKLVDGVNIATINGQSLTNGGDVTIEAGSIISESDISAMGFTKNTGTYSKPSTGIPKSDLASAVQTSLGKADTALQSFTESDPVFSASAAAGIKSSDITNWNNKTSNTGTITGIKMNGASKGTSGVVDLGTVITAHQDISGKQDKLVSGTNIKTINGTSILGSGDITIESGSSDANVSAVDTGDVVDDVNVDYATTAYVDSKVANIDLTNYTTTAYVDGLVGDINSVLESIING